MKLFQALASIPMLLPLASAVPLLDQRDDPVPTLESRVHCISQGPGSCQFYAKTLFEARRPGLTGPGYLPSSETPVTGELSIFNHKCEWIGGLSEEKGDIGNLKVGLHLSSALNLTIEIEDQSKWLPMRYKFAYSNGTYGLGQKKPEIYQPFFNRDGYWTEYMVAFDCPETDHH